MMLAAVGTELDRWASRAAREVLESTAADEFGSVTPSVYETSRLVRTARWLPGHGSRLRFLVASQNTDGSWGQPDGYALVPTLGATEALLAELREPPVGGAGRDDLVACVASGLRALRRWLERPAHAVPDTIGVETIVSWLVGETNDQLARLAVDPVAGLDTWAGTALPLPAGLDHGVRLAL